MDLISRKQAAVGGAVLLFLLILTVTAFAQLWSPQVHSPPENKIIDYQVDAMTCYADRVTEATIVPGHYLSNGAREVTVTGKWANSHQNSDYPVELRQTGDQTLMMLIRRAPQRVENGSACIRGTEQGIWGMNVTADLHIDPQQVDTLRVYYNGEQVAMKKNLSKYT